MYIIIVFVFLKLSPIVPRHFPKLLGFVSRILGRLHSLIFGLVNLRPI